MGDGKKGRSEIDEGFAFGTPPPADSSDPAGGVAEVPRAGHHALAHRAELHTGLVGGLRLLHPPVFLTE